MQTPYRFFHAQAGYSHNPATETKAQGRARCARALAAAETRATRVGLSFEWQVDQCTDSSEFDDGPEPWALWLCIARDADGSVVASLGGIDFGPDGEPWGNSYRRVVEAELALESLTN